MITQPEPLPRSSLDKACMLRGSMRKKIMFRPFLGAIVLRYKEFCSSYHRESFLGLIGLLGLMAIFSAQ